MDRNILEKCPPPVSKELFLGGIPIHCTLGIQIINKVKISQYLSQFGEVISCRLAYSKKGILRGYGFAELATLEQSLKAIGKYHSIKGKKVSFYKFNTCLAFVN